MLDGEFGGVRVGVAKAVLPFQCGSSRGATEVHPNHSDGHFLQSRFGLPGLLFSTGLPFCMEDLSPSDSGHQEGNVLTSGFAQEAFDLLGNPVTIFEQANECVGVQHVAASLFTKRSGHYFSPWRSRSRSSNRASKCDGSPGAGFRNPRISLMRCAVIGVSTSRPFSSLQVARVPFSNPNCSRSSAGITTWPLELITVR